MSKDETTDIKYSPGEGISPKASRLGQTVVLDGDFRSDEDLIIEGQLKGKIDLHGQNLVIERGSRVTADIRAKHVTVNGALEGNIWASGRVLISKEAQMKGDIHASRISIMEGALFKGSIRMEKEKGA
jgi:cytoskeletal protein CcmA (bactofilin family)